MIRINESIRYQNVVTKKVYFHYTEMENELNSFLESVKNVGVGMLGPLTYALYNVPNDENLLVEFIMPVDCNDIQNGDVTFHSYYSVENMASQVVFGNYQTQMEYAYASLIDFFKQNNWEIVTPIFHVVSRDRKYIEVMIGY